MMRRDTQEIEVAPAPPRRKSRRVRVSIGLALGLGLPLLIAVPLAVVIILNIEANVTNTFGLLNQRAVVLIEAIETGTRRHLEGAAEAAKFAARMHREGEVDLTDRSAALPVLRGISAALPNVEALIVYQGTRHVAGVFRNRDDQYGEIPAGVESSADVRHALVAANQRQEPAWGRLVFSEDRVYANYTVPLERNGEHNGVLVAAVSLTTLSEILADISSQFDTTAFVLNSEGQVVAHPNLASLHPEITAETPTVRIDRVGDLTLAAYPRREPIDQFDVALQRGVAVSVVEVAQLPHIVITREIDGVALRPWTVGAHFTAQNVGGEVQRLMLALAVSAGAFIVALVLAFVLSHLLARPIRRFAKQAALITDLDLERVDAMPPSRIREIDEGVTAFNAMLDGLRAFAAYVPRTLVNRLVHSGVKATTRSSERELTIMFTDIVGFTTLAERMPASEAAELLNHHFQILGSIIEANGGTVDKFVGDGLMAFWGAPEVLSDHAAAACRSAVAIAAAIARDNAQAAETGRTPFRIRIGIHTGPVIVGNIGGGGRINYTIIGDAVNVCERLQELGHEIDPQAPAAMFVSEDTMVRAGDGFVVEESGQHLLRGRSTELKVYRLQAAISAA